MLFANKYEVSDANDLSKKVLEVFPDPRDLIKQQIKLSWAEEAALDRIAGMFWPAILCQNVTEAYNQAGTSWNGFCVNITFPQDNSGVVLTFERTSTTLYKPDRPPEEMA